LIVAGAFALWGDSKKDADGYLSTGTEAFSASTRALASERIDIDIDSKDWLAGVDDLGKTRMKVASASGERVFAGVAPTRDVTAYLRGVEHTVLDDIESSPFSARYREHDGARAPAPPAGQDIWAAQTEGSGPLELQWTPEPGDWSVVVMNADGSPGVSADVSAGAEIAFLEPLGWSLTGGGLVLLLAGGALVLVGVRPRRTRPLATATPVAS
jgi:hypothetical protein